MEPCAKLPASASTQIFSDSLKHEAVPTYGEQHIEGPTDELLESTFATRYTVRAVCVGFGVRGVDKK